MNKTEHLLTCLIEELSEVQQEISKCLRFTLEHTPPEYPQSNLQRVSLEMADVRAVMVLLSETGINIENLESHEVQQRFSTKKLKTVNLLLIAKKLGALV